MRIRLRFNKSGPLRFVGHLDLAEAVHRLLRRSGAPLAHSQGFNPQPRISFSPPLPLGFEGVDEICDVQLTERIDPFEWLASLRALEVPGLVWTGLEEIDLKAASPQQAITAFDYDVAWTKWGEEANTLPLEAAEVEKRMDEFLSSHSWPIAIVRKGKKQQRDARSFVKDMHLADEPSGHGIAIRMTIRSDNGTTLSPLRILEAIFGESPQAGVILNVRRRPLLAR